MPQAKGIERPWERQDSALWNACWKLGGEFQVDWENYYRQQENKPGRIDWLFVRLAEQHQTVAEFETIVNGTLEPSMVEIPAAPGFIRVETGKPGRTAGRGGFGYNLRRTASQSFSSGAVRVTGVPPESLPSGVFKGPPWRGLNQWRVNSPGSFPRSSATRPPSGR